MHSVTLHLDQPLQIGGFVTLDKCLQNKLNEVVVLTSTFSLVQIITVYSRFNLHFETVHLSLFEEIVDFPQ